VTSPPGAGAGSPDEHAGEELVELGTWPRLDAQVLRRRLETAGITPVVVEWDDTAATVAGRLLVPASRAEFASAVVHEIDVDDEIPDASPLAYVSRIEELLAAAGGLLDELRTRLEEDGGGDAASP
jgi:hypothetical protein